MIIAWENLADDADVTADSEESTLPVTNIQQPHLSQQWHTLAGVSSAYALFDMGASVICSVLAVLGTNLTATATLRLRASVSDATATGSLAYDSGSISAGVKAAYPAAYKSFDAVSARYWRLDLDDASLPDNLQIGRVFLGPSWTPAIAQDLGQSLTVVDPSQVVRSTGGQTYVNELPRMRRAEFTLASMTKAEAYGSALAMAMANGRARDILAIDDISDTYLPEQAVFGLVESEEPIVNRLLGVWSKKYTVTERL